MLQTLSNRIEFDFLVSKQVRLFLRRRISITHSLLPNRNNPLGKLWKFFLCLEMRHVSGLHPPTSTMKVASGVYHNAWQRKWRGSIVNREVLISCYCQFVAGLVHFWNIYTGGTLYAAFSPVCDLFLFLWIYILRLRQSLESSQETSLYILIINKEKKKELWYLRSESCFHFSARMV